MKQETQEGFVLRHDEIQNDIFIPRYYDPRISNTLEALTSKFHCISIRELVASGRLEHAHGSYVPKIFYGTGPFPYIRTSDIANWELKASPKHGVPQHVYDDYAEEQAVSTGDILFVHEGTYLIGAVAMVTDFDGKILYQHHLAKFTVRDSCPFNKYYLLAAFEAPAVRRQIRAKQFSADIIDSVVGRVEEVVIPYPKDQKLLRTIEKTVDLAVNQRAVLRAELSDACLITDSWLAGECKGDLPLNLSKAGTINASSKTAFLGGRKGFMETCISTGQIRNDILLPKYYDPSILERAQSYQSKCDVTSISALVEAGVLEVSPGDEIGRLNYGTGEIPFVRTSDFGSWELKREAKQGVSEQVYAEFADKQDVAIGDILLVRDGTYLVGTSVLVTSHDLPLLFCGGILKIRSSRPDVVAPGLLFALLNLPFTKKQFRNLQFTRDVIDTLGHRLNEVFLPIPRCPTIQHEISTYFHTRLSKRAEYRSQLVNTMETMFEEGKRGQATTL